MAPEPRLSGLDALRAVLTMASASTAELQRATRNTIGDAFHRAVHKFPHKEALSFEQRRWTYVALEQAAHRVANALVGLGLRPGDRVAAYGKNSDAYAILWLACAQAGLIHVPINFALTEGELTYIVAQSGARALWYDDAMAGHVEPVRAHLPCSVYGTLRGGEAVDILAVACGDGDARAPRAELNDTDVAQLLYTSGTTAAPKGAMMTHRALLAEYTSTIVAAEIAPHDRVLAALPLYHSAQMHVFLMPELLVGGTTILVSGPQPAVCLRMLEQERINSFFAPPTVWIALLRDPAFDRHDLSSLRKAYYGASIMPLPVLQELGSRLPGVRLFNLYGQSEIAPLATVLGPEEHHERPTSAGRAILNVETRVVNEALEDLPPGELGEIVHRSPQVMVGYWDKPDETAAAFAGGWFHSGDVGYFDEAGYLYVVDRIKDIINTGGVVVSSREVEECLYTHPAVSEVAVIALPDAKWIEAVTAVVVIRADCRVSGEELIAHARGRLAPFKVPKSIVFMDELPRNTAGKLLKRELRARLAAEKVGSDAAA